MQVFQFKQFQVEHRQSAMKIGTDAVLLGAWADASGAKTGLDIGTGTGVLALMLAQRYPELRIHALEIEEKACAEAKVNFRHSPWKDRLLCMEGSLYHFTKEHRGQYDFIISNPPYFEPSKITAATVRSMARTTSHLSHVSLLRNTRQLLRDEGTANYIIPYSTMPFFLDLARTFGLHPERITLVHNRKETPPVRSLLRFRTRSVNCREDDIYLHTNDGKHSTEYIGLLKDYLLGL